MKNNIRRYLEILEQYKKLNDSQRLNIKEVLTKANTSFIFNRESLLNDILYVLILEEYDINDKNIFKHFFNSLKFFENECAKYRNKKLYGHKFYKFCEYVIEKEYNLLERIRFEITIFSMKFRYLRKNFKYLISNFNGNPSILFYNDIFILYEHIMEQELKIFEDNIQISMRKLTYLDYNIKYFILNFNTLKDKLKNQPIDNFRDKQISEFEKILDEILDEILKNEPANSEREDLSHILLKSNKRQSIELLKKNHNSEILPRGPFWSIYNSFLLSYIINQKILFGTYVRNKNTEDYHLFKIRILIWSIVLIYSINYGQGQKSQLTKAHKYFTYKIIEIFINELKDDYIDYLDNIDYIFAKISREDSVPQLKNDALKKRLNCMLYGYLIGPCYYLDTDCVFNKGTIEQLIKSCKYRVPDVTKLSNSNAIYKCKKIAGKNNYCEFYNYKNYWLQDFKPFIIKLKQKYLIYFFDLDIDNTSLNKYITGKSVNISPLFINKLSDKTGIPRTYLTDLKEETFHGLRKFYFFYQVLSAISAKEIYYFHKEFSQYFEVWAKNPTPKWDEDKKSVKELKDIKTFLNKADMYIINIVFKVFRQNPDLKDIKIYKKTADKIKHLLKETGKISESYDLF